MAVTATVTILTTAASLPSGFTPPPLPPLAEEAEGSYSVDLPISLADAGSATTGLNAVIAAAKTDFQNVQAVRMKMDAALSIAVNVTIRTIIRLNTSGTSDGNIFITGTEVFRLDCTFKYA